MQKTGAYFPAMEECNRERLVIDVDRSIDPDYLSFSPRTPGKTGEPTAARS
jgi:hypothetical protein